MSIKSKRKLKYTGITPPSSFLIHPATLQFIKNNKNNDNETIYKKDSILQNSGKYKNIFAIPRIDFNPNKILSFYNIKYIVDLEEYIKHFTNSILLSKRLISLFFDNNKNLNNITPDDIPNIYEFINRNYNINNDTIYNNFKKLDKKTFNNIFI